MLYAGLDIHLKHISVCVLDENGKQLRRARVPSLRAEALDDLLPDRWLQSHPECRWQIAELRRDERARKVR